MMNTGDGIQAGYEREHDEEGTGGRDTVQASVVMTMDTTDDSVTGRQEHGERTAAVTARSGRLRIRRKDERR